MAGNVSRRDGSTQIGISDPIWLCIAGTWVLDVAISTLADGAAERICPYTLSSIEIRRPSSERKSRINCFERISFERGHSRLPEPPDKSTRFINLLLQSSSCLPVRTPDVMPQPSKMQILYSTQMYPRIAGPAFRIILISSSISLIALRPICSVRTTPSKSESLIMVSAW